MLSVNTGSREIRFSFRHQPPFERMLAAGDDPWEIVLDPGFTDCRLVVDEVVYEATAWCSAKDVWNKDIGRKVSLTKAMKTAGLNKDERTWVWHRYHMRQETNAKFEEMNAGMELR